MTEADWISELERRVAEYSNESDRTLANGTQLVDNFYLKGFTHTLFPSLSKTDVEELEQQIERSLPSPISDFYRRHNGLHLFHSGLSIKGLRHSYSRTGDASQSYPFDLHTSNVLEFPDGLDPSWLVFGFLGSEADGDDGAILAMSPSGNNIARLDRDGHNVLETWNSLGECVLSEFDRLAKWWNTLGRQGTIDTLKEWNS